MDKREVRNRLLQQRQALTKEEVDSLSERISYRLFDSEYYQSAKRICVYQAFRKEVTCGFIMEDAWKNEKEVYVPVTDFITKTMDFYLVTPETKWVSGAYGILEPFLESGMKPLQEKALILMPGLAFDRKKNRIGYGGGYYDKYLAAHPIHQTAALCYDFQIVAFDIPGQSHDWIPDCIVTEKQILL